MRNRLYMSVCAFACTGEKVIESESEREREIERERKTNIKRLDL